MRVKLRSVLEISWRAETKATGVMWTHGQLECITIPAILSPWRQFYSFSPVVLPKLAYFACVRSIESPSHFIWSNGSSGVFKQYKVLMSQLFSLAWQIHRMNLSMQCMYMPSCQKCGNRYPSKHIVWIWKLCCNFFVTLEGCRAQHCSLAVAVTAHLRRTWILNFDISWHWRWHVVLLFRHGKAVGRLSVSTCSASAFSGS